MVERDGITNVNGPCALIWQGHAIANDIFYGVRSPLAERNVVLAWNPGLGVIGANWMVNEAARVSLARRHGQRPRVKS